jgi:hypothetical protein
VLLEAVMVAPSQPTLDYVVLTTIRVTTSTSVSNVLHSHVIVEPELKSLMRRIVSSMMGKMPTS